MIVSQKVQLWRFSCFYYKVRRGIYSSLQFLFFIIAVFLFYNDSYALDIKPYIGVGLVQFNINTNATHSSGKGTTDFGSSIELCGGAFFGDSGKINLFYFQGEEGNSEVMKVQLFGVSYDYNFNNQGLHKGFVLGFGTSNVRSQFKESDLTKFSNDSSFGLLFRMGYEYVSRDGFGITLMYNVHTAKQRHKPFKYNDKKIETNVNNLSLLAIYRF